MPRYSFKCSDCGKKIEVIRPMKNASEPWYCLCGKQMQRDYRADNIMTSNKDYSRPIVSDSLAVNMSQIQEHKKLFPDVKITNEGQPIFENYKQHQKYLDATGFVKVPAKQKFKGKKISR